MLGVRSGGIGLVLFDGQEIDIWPDFIALTIHHLDNYVGGQIWRHRAGAVRRARNRHLAGFYRSDHPPLRQFFLSILLSILVIVVIVQSQEICQRKRSAKSQFFETCRATTRDRTTNQRRKLPRQSGVHTTLTHAFKFPSL